MMWKGRRSDDRNVNAMILLGLMVGSTHKTMEIGEERDQTFLEAKRTDRKRQRSLRNKSARFIKPLDRLLYSTEQNQYLRLTCWARSSQTAVWKESIWKIGILLSSGLSNRSTFFIVVRFAISLCPSWKKARAEGEYSKRKRADPNL